MVKAEKDANMIVASRIDRVGIKFYNVEEEPFRLYGVFREGGYFARLPMDVADKTVNRANPGSRSNSTGGRVRFITDSPYVAVHAEIDGITYRGIANFGACPTFGVKYTKVEVHFDGFDGDLYGRELDVYFDFYMRDIQKFNDTQALIAQLQKDLLCIRQ